MTANGLSAPGTKKGKLQRIILKMLRAREHQPDGLPTNTRFIYYELVQSGIVPKPRKEGASGRRSDQNTCEAVFWLRDKGLIPWDWIVDETRRVITYRSAATVLDYLKDTIALARISPWGDELPPAILCESRSLAGVLRNVAYEYLVQIAPTNGQCGGFLRTDVAPLLSPGQRVGYLGDQDLCGGQIEANTRKVLEELIGGELDWHRIAITEQQVELHGLPVISKPDRRYKPARWHDAVETEALGQAFIVNLVREWLDSLLPEPIKDVREREKGQRARMRAALARIARRR
jgi:hypothetical protein